MNQEQAIRFAHEWIRAFNAHDLPAILAHYDEKVEFYSPVIQQLKFNESGQITNKRDLERYFQIGLNAHPTLHFKLLDVFAGINTLVIYYTSVDDRKASEVFQLSENGKAQKVFCNYILNQSIV